MPAMPAAPLPTNELERLASLLSIGVLDSAPDASFQELVEFAARVCRVPTACVSLIDSQRQLFIASHGTKLSQVPRTQSVCAHAILSHQPLHIADMSADPRSKDSPLVTGVAKARSYLGVPLLSPDGFALGTLSVLDVKARHFTWQEVADLSALARQAANLLELKRAHTKVVASERQAARASRDKARFFASMSHELRTHMTGVLGYIDLLLDDTAAGYERAAYGIVVRHNADNLMALINDFTDFSRLEAGSLDIHNAPCSPAKLVLDVIETLGTAAEDKSVSLTARMSTPIPESVVIDAHRLRQVLLNLTSNAVKFTNAGSITLSVGIARSPTGEQLCFDVIDTGVGMTPDQLDTLFQPFQGDHTDAALRTLGGTGLGLVISRRLALLMGGEVTAISTFSQGSTFTFALPMTSNTVPAGVRMIEQWDQIDQCQTTPGLGAENSGESPVLFDSDDHHPLRILLAEDSTVVQHLIEHFISKAGMEITTVDDGQQAIDTALTATPPFDVVLMDVQMPVVDGCDAARQLRDRGYTRPIIALTASAQPEDRARCLDAGMDTFLTKPIERKALIEACKQAARQGLSKAAQQPDRSRKAA